MRCFGVGYQGRSVAALCDVLVGEGVDLLIDVRERAWSNRPEFRKTALASSLAAAGIQYIHVRQAGNPFRPRLGEAIDPAECLKRYRGYLQSMPSVTEDLKVLIGSRRVALLCYEAKSADCHRGVLLSVLKRESPQLMVTHL
jgi:uncharacterized protein (DUF488 family)